MNILTWFWQELINRPILNLLVILLSYTHSLGLTIIIIVVIVQVLLAPLTIKRYHVAQKMANLYPQLQKLLKKYKKDPKKLKIEQAKLYKKNGVKKFANFGLILLSLPILFALYSNINIISKGTLDQNRLYSTVKNMTTVSNTDLSTNVSKSFMGINLISNPTFTLLALLAITSFLSSYISYEFFNYIPKDIAIEELKEQLKKTNKDASDQELSMLAKSMYYTRYLNLISGPLVLIFIMKSLPAVITFYILIFNLVQAIINGVLYVLTKGGVKLPEHKK